MYARTHRHRQTDRQTNTHLAIATAAIVSVPWKLTKWAAPPMAAD